jgi:hypothetical protein
MKNRHKKYSRKILCFSLAVLFSLSFFATSGFSNSDCGQMCCCSSPMNSTHHAIKNSVKLNGDCCSQMPTHACRLTGGNKVELPICTLHAVRADTGGSLDAAAIITTQIYTKNLIRSKYGQHSNKRLLQFTPIYLQHLSLII